QVSRDWRYSGALPEGHSLRLRGYHSLWPHFPGDSTMSDLCNSVVESWLHLHVPRHRRCNAYELTHLRFRLFPFRSPLLGESRFLSVPAGTEMGQFPAFPTACYGFTYRSWGFTPSRFRISEIPGSEPVCGSPRLIAA